MYITWKGSNWLLEEKVIMDIIGKGSYWLSNVNVIMSITGKGSQWLYQLKIVIMSIKERNWLLWDTYFDWLFEKYGAIFMGNYNIVSNWKKVSSLLMKNGLYQWRVDFVSYGKRWITYTSVKSGLMFAMRKLPIIMNII